MCRLFGHRSAQILTLDKPFLSEETSLSVQSGEHRDGWGLAYYVHDTPHVIKSTVRAGDDREFVRIAMNVCAPTVIAHLRRATQGEISLLNCHPFQYGAWVMAHNGDLPEWASMRNELLPLITPSVRWHVFGSTDSEIFFALFLTGLEQLNALHEPLVAMNDIAKALRFAAKCIDDAYCSKALAKPFALNAIVSNGRTMLAYRHGKELFYRIVAAEAIASVPVASLTVCSTPTSAHYSFLEMRERQIIGIDGDMLFHVDL